MKRVSPDPEHQALWQDLAEAIRKHPNIHPEAILAILSQMVGQVIAMQDSTIMTPPTAMKIVEQNVLVGNEAAIQDLQEHTEDS